MAKGASPVSQFAIDEYRDGIERETMFTEVRDLLKEWLEAADGGTAPPAIDTFAHRLGGSASANLIVMRSVDRDFLYEQVGPEATSLLGHDPTGRCLSAIRLRGAQAFVRRYQRCLSSGKPMFTLQRKVGFGIPGSSERLILPVRLADGGRGLLVYLRSRADNHELIRAVFNASLHGILVLTAVRDPAGRAHDLEILAVNAAAAKFAGRAPESLVGLRLKSMVPAEGWAGLWPDLSACLETGADRVAEVTRPADWMPGVYRFGMSRVGDGLAVTISDLSQLRDAARTLETQHAALVKVNAELRSEVERRRRLEATLKELAATDPLTGVANRRAFIEAVMGELDSRAPGAAPALILFDIDDFKAINDAHGHPAGDAVLRDVARAVVERLGPGAVLGRLGGEEFGVFLPAGETAQHSVAADMLRRAIADARCGPAGRPPIRVTASFGVAVVRTGRENIEELIARADDALYAAKRAGRNRVAFAQSATRAAGAA